MKVLEADHHRVEAEEGTSGLEVLDQLQIDKYGTQRMSSPQFPTSKVLIYSNKHLATPLPTIIGSNPTIASPIPQPGITILRREPGANDKKKGGGTATPPKTMEEREEEYRLTRERIFGGNAAVGDLGDGALGREQSRSGGGKSRLPQTQSERRELFEPSLGIMPTQVRRSPAPPSGVLRQPMGPGEGGGFGR
jgi:hypothetical protein